MRSRVLEGSRYCSQRNSGLQIRMDDGDDSDIESPNPDESGDEEQKPEKLNNIILL